MFVICLVIADMISSNLKPQLQISENQLNLKDDDDMGWIIPKLRRYKWHADQIVQKFNKHYILFSFYVTNIGHYMGFMRPINILHYQIFSLWAQESQATSLSHGIQCPQSMSPIPPLHSPFAFWCTKRSVLMPKNWAFVVLLLLVISLQPDQPDNVGGRHNKGKIQSILLIRR